MNTRPVKPQLTITFAIFSLMLSFSLKAQEFEASQGSSDAFIVLNWSIPNSCLRDAAGQPYPKGVFLQILNLADGAEIYSYTVENYQEWMEKQEALTGNYKHYAGPDKSVEYQLNLFQIGNGAKATCTAFMAYGQTSSFLSPEFTATSDADQPGQIELRWANTSDWATSLLLKREEVELAYYDINLTTADTFFYLDAFLPEDSLSIVNGVPYTYCLKPFSKYNGTFYDEVCAANLSTYDIGLDASDEAYSDKVILNWRALSAFGDQIQLFRDDVIIAEISPAVTVYTDHSPVPGKNSIYRIELLSGNQRIASDSDTGGIPANGLISGQVLTAHGLYPVANAQIQLKATIGNENVHLETYTNYAGHFDFPDLYYNSQAIFTLSAYKEGERFEEPEQSVGLSIEQPANEAVTFFMASDFETGAARVAIAGFTAEPKGEEDEVHLSWQYSADADTVFFNIYRNGELIASFDQISGTSASFSDLTGLPNTDYSYTLTAFIIQDDTISRESQSQQSTFPGVAPVVSFYVEAADSLGYVQLNWDKTSGNFYGFKLYRDHDLIADLEKGINAFQDLTGAPGASVSYSIVAYRRIGRADYESAPVYSDTVAYPVLPALTSLRAVAINGKDRVQIEWDIPPILTTGYNYTGFKIYRNGKEAAAVIKELTPFFEDNVGLFIDWNGAPEVAYEYEIRSYREDGAQIILSEKLAEAATFPAIQAPTGLAASDGAQSGEVQLSWDDHPSDNIDGFFLYRDGALIADLNPGLTSYTHYTHASESANYELRAYRLVEDSAYISAAASDTGAALAGEGGLSAPNHFQASTDQASSVALSWQYPEYILAEFVISRDGMALDTLPTQARSFSDFNAASGSDHLYAVKAIYEESSAQEVKAMGRLRSRKSVSGRYLLNDDGYGFGVPNILIRASASNYFAQTHTDSAGYFRIEGLPDEQGLTITLSPQSPVVVFGLPGPLSFTIGPEEEYVQDFIVGFTPAMDSSEVAQAARVFTCPDLPNMQVVINWSATNTNYSGFEVYRMNTLIGTVEKGAPMQFTDTEGAPGINYFYKVRAYLEEEGSRQYSNPGQSGVTFPSFPAGSNLTATSILKENKVRLSWGHPYALATEYRIVRNGEWLASLPGDGLTAYEDTSGLPGQTYRYEVIAVAERGSQAFQSEPASLQIEYPAVAPASTFQSSIPDAEEKEDTTVLNHVFLEWEYVAEAADSFWLYRDGGLIAKMAPDAGSYSDYEGLPGTACKYTLSAVILRQGLPFESEVQSAGEIFPELAAPVNFTVGQMPDMGNVQISFRYLADGADGFYVFRGRQSGPLTPIDTIYDDTFSATEYKIYMDENGTPDVSYYYAVQAFSLRANEEYASELLESAQAVSYPRPPAVADFQATDGDFYNYVQLSWLYGAEINCDGFIIERQLEGTDNWTVLDTLGQGRRFYRDVLDMFSADSTQKYEYNVRAFRTIAGEVYAGKEEGATGMLARARLIPEELQKGTGFGEAIAIDGDYAIVGRPYMDGTGQIRHIGAAYIYKKENHMWGLKQELQTETGDGLFGTAVAVSDNIVVVGASAMEEDGGVYIYSRTGEEWKLDTILTPIYEADLNDEAAMFGTAVAISQNRVVIGAPLHTISPGIYGAAYVYEKENNKWQYKDLLTIGFDGGNQSNYFGLAVAIQDDIIAIGAPWSKAPIYPSYPVAGTVWLYEKNDSGWENFDMKYSTYTNAAFGSSIALGEDYLAVGAPGLNNDKGAAYVYQRDNYWKQVAELGRPNEEKNENDRFGGRLGIDGKHTIVSCRYCNDSKGAAYLYEQEGEDWPLKEKYQLNDGEVNDYYGYDVALSEQELLIGAPGNEDVGAIYWYNITPPVGQASASDGKFETKVEVSWQYSGGEEKIDGFKIYRDGAFLVQINDADQRTYFDGDAETTPGYRYLYQVTTYDGQAESQPQADEGYRQANGTLKGVVQTEQGSPVEGATLSASAEIDGEYYAYEAISGQDGHFVISHIYYGVSEAEYTLAPSYPGHTFKPAGKTAVLSKDQPKQEGIQFLDETAYMVVGLASQQNVSCGLDSVKVTAISLFEDGTEQSEESYTNTEGRYSLMINPAAAGLQEIRVEIAPYRILGDPAQADTVLHEFSPSYYTLAPDTLGRETVKDFTDTLTYEVELLVQNTCLQAISSDSFQVRVRDEQVCYDSIFTTGPDGKVRANLPPLNYLISVVDVDNPTQVNTAAVDYLRNRPVALGLYTIHKDGAQPLDEDQLAGLTRRRLTYHTPPSIQLSGFSRFFCDDPAKAAIVEQDMKYTLLFEVLEQHDAYLCPVQEGYLRITNPAAQDTDPVTLSFSESATTLSYTFTAGAPNLAAPFSWGLRAEYFSAAGDFLGNIVQPVIVEGYATVPGNDIIVDPGEDGGVPFPLFVLRDPPGDNSFSSIAKGQTISKSVSISDESSGSSALLLETEGKVTGYGAEFELEIGMGGGSGRSRSWDFEITTNEAISTSSSPNLVGREADVIVGAGLAMQYGLVQELTVTACDSVTIAFKLGFTPHSVSTTWAYTVGHIEGLIEEYRQDLVELEEGALALTDYTTEEAQAKINTYIDNWTQVLHYHDVETLPHYLLCTQPIDRALPPGIQSEIGQWQEAFCSMIGGYDDANNFVLYEDIVWDDALVTAYNNTAAAIRNLSDETLDMNEAGDLVWRYGENAFEHTSDYVDQQYNAAFGILAENRTFSGGAQYTRTINAAQTSTKSFNSNFFLESTSKLLVGQEVETETWFGFGGGFVVPAIEYSIKGGVKVAFEYKIQEDKTTAETNTVEISYTLDDDDPDDHFSVTAIQGMSQNHTPYFSLLGGRSSCPGEEGTILIHDVKFQLYDPENEVSYTELSLSDMPSDEPAIFWVQAINNSPFGDTLNLVAFVDNASNENGAFISLAGVSNTQEVPFYNIAPGVPVIVPLTIERGSVAYHHEDIRIGLRPDCSDGPDKEAAYISVSVDFLKEE